MVIVRKITDVLWLAAVTSLALFGLVALSQGAEPLGLQLFQNPPLQLSLFSTAADAGSSDAETVDAGQPLGLTLFAAADVAELPSHHIVAKPAAPDIDRRPILKGYEPTFACAACVQLKRNAGQLPFVISWEVDYHGTKPAYPLIEATVNGRVHQYQGGNLAGITRWYELLQQPQQQAAAVTGRSSAPRPAVSGNCATCRRVQR